MWTDCMLEGEALYEKARALALEVPGPSPRSIYRREFVAWLIETQQIFLDPPHEVHRHGGSNAGWSRVNCWSATVSARTRTFKNEFGADCVGRGIGADLQTAVLRAFVASCKDVPGLPF